MLRPEYVFEEDLSNHDRAVVHAECRKYGFTSKSHGYVLDNIVSDKRIWTSGLAL